MSFPSQQYSSDATAQAGFVNAALTKGLTIDGLTVQGQLFAACANMLVTAPADSVNLVDINDYGADGGYIRSNGSAWVRTSGFALADATGTLAGANGGTGVANTSKTITLGHNLVTSGAFALTLTTTGTTNVTLPTSGTVLVAGAAISGTTLTASTSATVTSASAVALTVGLAGATNPAFVVDASTASQAAGFSVTGAVAAGTVALAIISSGADASLTLNAKGAGTIGIGSVSTGLVTITPATTHTGAVIINNTVQLGTAAAANLITIGGTAYGAGVASLRLNGLTTAAIANQVGTMTNAPSAGDPTFWLPINIAGATKYIPCWS